MDQATIHKNANLVQKIFCIYGLYMIFKLKSGGRKWPCKKINSRKIWFIDAEDPKPSFYILPITGQ
jgi:hypothetical protein